MYKFFENLSLEQTSTIEIKGREILCSKQNIGNTLIQPCFVYYNTTAITISILYDK